LNQQLIELLQESKIDTPETDFAQILISWCGGQERAVSVAGTVYQYSVMCVKDKCNN